MKLYYGWVLVVTLGITETISWGILHYAFTVYLGPMEAEMGWTRGDMAGAYSLALLVAGVAAIPVGRWLDRFGPRLLMTLGSIFGSVLVLAWSGVADLTQLYLVWFGIGLCMSVTLYDPAFATVTKWFDRHRVRALTAVTLMAGFASTIFIPLAGWLVQTQGWRQSLVILAVILAVRHHRAARAAAAPAAGGPRPGARRRGADRSAASRSTCPAQAWKSAKPYAIRHFGGS